MAQFIIKWEHWSYWSNFGISFLHSLIPITHFAMELHSSTLLMFVLRYLGPLAMSPSGYSQHSLL